ncbi:Bug family tripartite tricarboxylate transporter substrate binding protein [Ramlibacter sp.]|uniref:Bug family tripartite tricarboxylate transporter substrate binding protein n=1 Tax=Ramlibacter sp. TaxID=1917967 RepID=UPI002FCC29A1
MQRKSFLVGAVCAGVLALSGQVAHAQAWPNKPVKIVVPFPAGGATDVISRALGQRLAAELGQTFVIDNKPGAASAIGAELVARSPADGYTLLMATSSSLVNNRFLYKKLSYDPDGFELISLVCVTPLVLVANTSLPGDNVSSIVQYAKANPGKVNYASYGTGTISHLATALVAQRSGVSMAHVPYKGASEALPALMGGHVSLYTDTIVSSVALIKDGKIKPIGVTTAKRTAILPNVPTIAEQGLPGFDMVPWYGVVAPKGTPKEVVERLRVAMAKVVQSPEFVAELAKTGAEPPSGGFGPAEFAALMKSEITKTAALMKDAGIEPQ